MYLLGIDFGGGSSKATLISQEGRLVAANAVEYSTSYPKPGFAEQNPEDWYAATCKNIRGILQKSGVLPTEIAAIALDAATHTAVLLDAKNQVLRPAIHWTDSRSREEVAYLKANYEDMILAQTFHNPDTIWTLPQLLWVQKHEPEIWAKTEKILFAKDYIRLRLCDSYDTDFIEAQGSMFFDYTKMNWSEELCQVLGFPVEKLPTLRKPTDRVGSVTLSASQDTGLAPGTPIFCGTTDTVMEVFASGAVNPGQMTVKLATAGRICVMTEKPYPHRNLINYSHIVPGLWYPGTATKSAAASYRWYRDTFGSNYKVLDRGAKSVAPGCDGLLYHPYLNGELTPYADPLLRGSFTGIRAGHTRGHFSRAVMEGVGFSLKACKKVLDELQIPHENSAVIIGGGASGSVWRQIVADMLNCSLIQVQNPDSSLGSAMLAGLGIGFFESPQDAVARCLQVESTTRPIPENVAIYDAIFPRYEAIHDALAPIYQEMP